MSNIYIIKQRIGGIEVIHRPTGYRLKVDLVSKDIPLNEIPPESELMFTAPGNNDTVCITCRDLTQYRFEVSQLQLSPAFQYVEVGAGLGEFIPHVVRTIPQASKPIVIDPANYPLMRGMIEYVQSLDLGIRVNEIAEILSRRAAIILDSSKVRLINMTLREAFETNLSLEGIADVVIDHGGAYSWCEETEQQVSESGYSARARVQDLEKRIAKPDGIVMCLPPPPLYFSVR